LIHIAHDPNLCYFGCEKTDILLERLIDFYAKDGDYIKAEKSLSLARFDRPFASVITALKDHPDRIISLVSKNLIDVAVLEAAIETLSKQLHVKHAMQILRSMREPPVRLLGILLATVSASESEEAGTLAFQAFQEAQTFMSPDKEAFHATLQACMKSGLLREVDTIANQCSILFSFDEAKAMLECWKLSGSREGAQKTREQLDSIKNPGVFAYNVLLYSIVMSANPATGQLLFSAYNDMKKNGQEPDDLTYDIILDFNFQSGEADDVDRAEQMFAHLQKRQQHHYEALIKGWLALKETKRARDAFFRQVEDYVNERGFGDICPSQELVSAITKQFLRHKRLLKAHHFVEDVNDLWLADYLPDQPDEQETLKPLLDAWGMSSFEGKDVYIDDILNYFQDFEEEDNALPIPEEPEEPEHPFRAPGDDPHGYDEPLFYQMEGLSDDEDKIDFPEAVEPDFDQFGDVYVDPASYPEEEEDPLTPGAYRRRGHWVNLPDNAFVDSSDEEDNDTIDPEETESTKS
jgi:hypothetical protein